MAEYEMTLPNTVLTFNLSADDQKLALILESNLEFKNMNSALIRVFAKSYIISNKMYQEVNVMEEDAFYSRNLLSKSKLFLPSPKS